MAELSGRSNYVLRPKGRLGRVWRWWAPVIKFVVVFFGSIALLHFGWGYYQEWRLLREMGALRMRGEPIRMHNFPFPRAVTPGEENAAVALQWAAASIDQWSLATDKIGWIDLTLPLSKEERQILMEGLAGNREP